MQKIKIAHIVNRIDIGGMENGVVNICNLIDSNRYIPYIICINGRGEMAERLNHHIKLFDLMFNGRNYIRYIYELCSILKKEKINIVHTHGWGAGSLIGVLSGRIANVKLIINGEHGTFFTKKMQIILQRLLFRLCDSNLAVSQTLKLRVANTINVSEDHITVVKNGVNTDLFCGNYPKEKIVRRISNQGYSIDMDTFNVFMIGSLKKVKAQNILLKAIEKVHPNKHLRLFLVGDGPDRVKLKKQAEKANINSIVNFMGNRGDIPELLSVAHILVSTSHSEGMSNVILEAMSSGVPVIATNTGSEEVIEDGVNGYLIKEGDFIKLAFYIQKLQCNNGRLLKLGKKARQLIINEYSLDKMITNYQELYNYLSRKNE